MGQGVWALALVFGGLGLFLLVFSLRVRSRRGLIRGETAALDDVTLLSKRHLLTGRPDRIVKQGGLFIPEEWKSSKKVEPWWRQEKAWDGGKRKLKVVEVTLWVG